MPRGQKKNKPGNINLLGIAGKKYKIIKKKKELWAVSFYYTNEYIREG